MTGVSFRNGAGWWGSVPMIVRDRWLQPYRVHFPQHWVFEGTGLSNDDVFGAGVDYTILGYETDAALFELATDVPVVTGMDGVNAMMKEYPFRNRASIVAVTILFFGMYRSDEGHKVSCMPNSSIEFPTVLSVKVT